MFGFIKNLLRKPADSPADRSLAASSSQPSARTTPARKASTPPPVPASQAGDNEQVPSYYQGEGQEVLLQAILNTLPIELRPRLLPQQVAPDRTVLLPLGKILPQLSKGVVKLPFGDVRTAAPDLFKPGAEADKVMVTIPLAEILPRLDPATIGRRRNRRSVEIPPDITSPFEGRGAGLSLGDPSTKPSRNGASGSGPSAPPEQPGPPVGLTFSPPAGDVPLAAPVQEPTAVPPFRQTTVSAPSPVPPSAPPPAPIPLPLPSRPAPLSTTAPVSRAPIYPVEPPAPAPGLRIVSVSSGTPAPAARSAPEPEPVSGAEPFVVDLECVSEGWPENLRKSIADSGLLGGKLALPAGLIEQGLKQGRVTFTWKALRAFIQPPGPATPSPYDNNVLEMPLKPLALLFVERQREAKANRRKVSVDQAIPDLFFGGSKTDPTLPSSPPKPADTNFYAREDFQDAVHAAASAARDDISSGAKLPARKATPNEIVTRASELPGVLGALIALPDGLVVAHRLPTECNPDTLAAFLPQIFSKVSQCTKELRMGELNNLNFTVGNVPWKIHRVNAIFFAAFGRPGEPLPTAQVAALAAELDHKSK